MIDTGTDTVLAQVVDGVGVITLNRPHRRNALHNEMYVAIPPLLERFAAIHGALRQDGAARAADAVLDLVGGAAAS